MFDPDAFELPPNFRREPVPDEPARMSNWRIASDALLASEDDVRKAMAVYCGMVRYVDDQVGVLINRLKTLDILDETIVLFWTDHGEYLGEHGFFHKLPHFSDCLVRIPAILRVPGKYAGRTYTGLTETIDLAPTLLDLLGLPIPLTMGGCSLANDFQNNQDSGKSAVWSEAGIGIPLASWRGVDHGLRAPFAPANSDPGAMYRNRRYKLSMYADDRCELYDLADDPWEVKNLFYNPAYAGIKAELLEEFSRHRFRLINRAKAMDGGNVDFQPTDPTRLPLQPPCSPEELRQHLIKMDILKG
jgi:arylsulfatase A-like enzyme